MTYHLGRGSSQLGEFTEDEIRAGLASGKFQASDLAWKDGMADWKPVVEVFPGVATTPSTPEVVTVPFDDPNSAGPAFAPPSSSPPSVSTNVSASVVPPVAPTQYLPPQGATGGNVGVGVMPIPGTAIASLILGLVSLVTCYFGLLFAIPGVICGHMAMSKIKNSGFQYEGKGLATAGLVLNYIWLGIAALVILGLIIFGLIGAASGALDAPLDAPMPVPAPASGPTSDV